MQMLFHPARIQPVKKDLYQHKNVAVAVLRLDEVHPVVSGNKWFKLNIYLQDAAQQEKKAILTFGGPWSNHLVATAAACAANGFASIGIVRGERPAALSHALADAQAYGMKLIFISREDYKNKMIPPGVYGVLKKFEIYEIAEGGYGDKGMLGSMGILKSADAQKYTAVIAAVGTGTMLAGLLNAAAPHQQVTGISVLKNNFSITAAVQKLLLPSEKELLVLHDYHFGGYAKHTPELLQFMNQWYADTAIPTDFVYTAKAFYAADRLIETGFFVPGSSVLLIHSGGLQGNRSLPAGALTF